VNGIGIAWLEPELVEVHIVPVLAGFPLLARCAPDLDLVERLFEGIVRTTIVAVVHEPHPFVVVELAERFERFFDLLAPTTQDPPGFYATEHGEHVERLRCTHGLTSL
jgi:hypothetical protein